jgi:hypothetical protein
MARLDKVGFAKQVAMGTKQATMEYFPPVESADVEDQRENIEQEETTGRRFPDGIDYGTTHWELGMKAAPRVSSLPRYASAYLGAPTTSTPDVTNAPTARSHVFDPAAAGKVPVPHSIFAVRKDPSTPIVDLFWDALGNEFSLSVEPNGFLAFEGSFIAKELDDTQADPSLTLDTSRRMVYDQAKVYISVDGGGETEVKVAGWGLTYGNGIDTDQAILGSRRLFTLAEDNAVATVRFSPRESLSTHYRRALQDDPASVKLRMTATGAIIGGAVAYKVEVIANAFEYLKAPANISASERLKKIDVEGRVKYDVSASKFVTLEVVNTVASY